MLVGTQNDSAPLEECGSRLTISTYADQRSLHPQTSLDVYQREIKCPSEDLYLNIHGYIIHNNQSIKTNFTSHQLMEEKMAAY